MEYITDPLNKFRHVNPHMMNNLLGLIPYWINFLDERSFKDQVEEKYGFGPLHRWSPAGKISEEGVYSSSGDPDLYPLAKWVRGDETVYLYEYAIIAFVTPEDTFVTRVD
jgi:hypothetical protein